ncbi:MAG: polysaccharide biosynthesis/export family protein [Gammaproteobacteria bacterium]|nr:polysaccharide biosynthesis/export family protein [Gammaproteobacteria bacterium]
MLNRFILTALSLSMTACSMAPGIYLEQGQFEPVAGKEEVEPVAVSLVPITPEVVQSHYRASRQSGSTGPAPSSNADYEYRVGPQDILNIIVWEHPELTIPTGGQRPVEQDGHKVNADGTIFYPYVGVLKVAGKTSARIRRDLTEKLSAYIRKPQLDVRVVAFHSQSVNVTGAVSEPGMMAITEKPLMLSDAVSSARVNAERADIQEVVLTRDGNNRLFDLLAFYYKGDLSQDIRLQDRDVVYVPANTVRKIYVMGEVNKSQTLPMIEGKLSLAEALATAGVDQNTAEPERIFVLRQGEDKPIAYHLDASEPAGLILATAFPLQALDVVFVSTADMTRWNRVLSQLLPTVQTLWAIDRIGE